MGRWSILVVAVALLAVCGVVAYLGGPVSSEPPRVAFEMDAPKRAFLREPTVLEVRVSNVGASPIRDLGVKINRGYANVFTVIDMRPRAMIDDASTEKRFYFGELAPGASQAYRITFSPQRTGDFNLTVRVVAVQRADPVPLTDSKTGVAELTATTSVVER